MIKKLPANKSVELVRAGWVIKRSYDTVFGARASARFNTYLQGHIEAA
jgi:hypothetical protein